MVSLLNSKQMPYTFRVVLSFHLLKFLITMSGIGYSLKVKYMYRATSVDTEEIICPCKFMVISNAMFSCMQINIELLGLGSSWTSR